MSAAPVPSSGEIVFTRSGDLYVIAPDGSHLRLLVRHASEAAVSRDGRRIAFVRDGAIWTMQRDGSGQQVLAKRPPVKPLWNAPSPAWSSDDRTVYFSRLVALDQGEEELIFRVNSDGTDLNRVTAAVTAPYAEHWDHCQENPSPSPREQVIAYDETWDCAHGNSVGITAVTFAGRTSKLPFRFPDTPVRFDPAWAPNGTLLAYVVLDVDAMNAWPERTGRSGVYVSSSDGSRPRRIARGSELLAPAWSPDGDWIAFEGAHGISLVGADGTGRHALIRMGSDPAWLPPTR